jgi:peptidoglycan/LPS O-acetylase OafA/YrhL
MTADQAATAGAAPQNARVKALDGLRGGAALCVAIMHYQGWFSPTHFLDSAYVAVDLFFVLSGVVIAMTYEGRILAGMGLAQFLGNRLARLYPLLLLTMVAGLLHAYALVLADKSEPGLWARVSDASSVVPNMLMQPSFNAEGTQALFPFNGPTWSVFAEVWINLAYFFWVRAGQRYLAPIVAAAGVGLAWLVLRNGSIDAGWGGAQILFGLLRAGSGFFIGVWIYRHRALLDVILRRIPVEAVVLAILLHPALFGDQSSRDLLAVFVLIPLCVARAMRGNPWLLENRMMQWLGVTSYSIYLWQAPFSLWFSSAARQVFGFDPGGHIPMSGLVWLVALLVVASISYRYIEVPAQRGIKKLFYRLI